jgi:polygalacturonase
LNAKAYGISMQRFYAKDPKVKLVFINRAKDITVRDITLEESPDWGLHIGNATNVLIEGITVLSSLEKGVNSDGIDIDGCKNVRISNCNIATGDDAICLKSTLRNGQYSSCENIVINNCTLVSTSTALKIGTESYGDFKDIIFSNCIIRNSNRGIGIIVRDGATVENILFTNLFIECNRKHFNWWGDGDPIRFILLKRNPESRLGIIKNIYVKNVIATGQGTSFIKGFDGKPLENIVLDNLTLMLQPELLPDKRATAILQIETANKITIKDATMGWDKERGVEKAWTFALDAKEVNGLTLDNIQCVNPINKTTLIQLSAISNLATGGTSNPDKLIIKK